MNTINDEVAAKLGKELAVLLHLKQTKNGRYDTTYGDKTPLGLLRTIERIINERPTAN